MSEGYIVCEIVTSTIYALNGRILILTFSFRIMFWFAANNTSGITFIRFTKVSNAQA